MTLSSATRMSYCSLNASTCLRAWAIALLDKFWMEDNENNDTMTPIGARMYARRQTDLEVAILDLQGKVGKHQK